MPKWVDRLLRRTEPPLIEPISSFEGQLRMQDASEAIDDNLVRFAVGKAGNISSVRIRGFEHRDDVWNVHETLASAVQSRERYDIYRIAKEGEEGNSRFAIVQFQFSPKEINRFRKDMIIGTRLIGWDYTRTPGELLGFLPHHEVRSAFDGTTLRRLPRKLGGR